MRTACLDYAPLGAGAVTLVDVKAAYARVLYESFQSPNEGNAQGLLLPVVVEVGQPSMAVALPRLEALERMGLVMRPLSQTSLLVEAIPSSLQNQDVAAWVADLLDQLQSQPEQPLERAACRSALRAPHSWTLQEVRPLVEQLMRCREPRVSPFGKPTLVVLSSDEIARYFH